VRIFELAKKLIDIPSVSGSEGAVGDFLMQYLKDAGFTITLQEISSARNNILALTDSPPKVLLCTHIDTVPPFFPATEDDEFIYGRGACDTKGISATMLTAANELLQSGVANFGLLFVVGEETDSIGAKKANELNCGSEYIIVGEPTDNRLAIGHKGILAFELKATGKAAHSAFPELGDSAVHKLLDVISDLRSLELPTDEILGKSTMNIGQIQGGVAHNVVANKASTQISIRTVTEIAALVTAIEQIVAEKCDLDIITKSEPQKLHTIPGYETVVLPYCTDIPHLKNFGKPMLFGPGSILVAHTADEKIPKQEMVDAVGHYVNLVKSLLAL